MALFHSATVAREVDAGLRELLARRTRLIPMMIVAGNLCFGIFDPWVHPPVLKHLVLLKASTVAIQLLVLYALRGTPNRLRLLTGGVISFVSGALAGTVSGILTDDPFTTPLLCVAGALTTAAVVPWGAAAQAVAAVVAVIAGAATSTTVGVPAPEYLIIGLSFVAAISVYVAYELDRQRASEANARIVLRRHQAELAHVLRVAAMGDGGAARA